MTKSPSSYNHKYVKIDGYNYHYVDEGSESGELLVFVHGWPELWISHKHQIEYFSKLGYRCVAVDLIGIGESEGPNVTDKHNPEAEGLSAYTSKNNCKALNYLVKEVLKREKAIFIGHDWGSYIIYRMPQYFPDTVKALASTCIDYIPPAEKWIELDDLIKINPVFVYQRDIAYRNWETECKEYKKEFFEVMYQYQGVKSGVEPILEEDDMHLVGLKAMHEGVKKYSNYDPMFNDEEFEYILNQYNDQVIANSCNYYRTRLLNYRDECEISDHYIYHPVLMVHSTGDITNSFFINRDPPTKEYCKNLTFRVVDGDHWIMLNKKNEVNTHIHNWLKKLNLRILNA